MRIKLGLDSSLTELEQKYPTRPVSLKKWTENNSQEKEEAERERALGLTKEQYEMILDSQRDRGAYVPPTFWIKQKAICEMGDGSETEAFDTLMDRREAELSKQIVRKATTTTKGLEMEMDEVTEAMQRELGELMKKTGVDLEGKNNGQINYGLIGDFLESFTSQTGLPGPVGNIAGRIGVDLLGKDKKKFEKRFKDIKNQ
ncbi:hypothetical protein PPACK8108_LOCUS15718 [Phakopsora pachyrhizi]|uniref:Uncharacterized protein n=1 Tax=Phakopsora pachyrhizi TaxID=170000 RepID=A0AAV0B6X0_PHAPC|nr:hypothetical protein PPACK8108_LOCUS15718 [Phakopsora pachyrhizi]